jgi:hypothetical protein
MTLNNLARLTGALRSAGLDCWTSANHQERPCLVFVMSSMRGEGFVWLRPMFTARAERIEMPVELAIAAIGDAAEVRLDAGVDPSAPATEGEARAVWQHLQHVATSARVAA